MKDKIISTAFSLPGVSILIGVLGFLSSLVTIFINVNEQLSIKWLLFSILISIVIILILLKVIYDLSQEIKPPQPFEHPIRYFPEEQVFVIRRNENFLNTIVVGCYAQQSEIDRLAFLGVVHLIQDKVIQIKVQFDYGVFESMPSTDDQLKNIVVRPVVPVTALQQLSNLEN
jgi:hypothetical protein